MYVVRRLTNVRNNNNHVVVVVRVFLYRFVRRCRRRGEYIGVHAYADQEPFLRIPAAIRRTGAPRA